MGRGAGPLEAPEDEVPADEAFDFFQPALRIDPNPYLHRFRARSSIHRNGAGWWVLGYDEANQAFRGGAFHRDRERFLDAFRYTLGEGRAYEYVTRRLTYFDPPEHGRIRGTVSRAFTPRRVEGIRPYVGRLAHELLDRVAGEPVFDILEHLAHPLPSLVICQLLGVPEGLRGDFDAWTQRIAHLIAPSLTAEQRAAGERAIEEEWACVEELVAARRRSPGDDLLSALVAAAEDGGRISGEELVANVIFFFSAGHQTTRDTLGVGLLGLLEERSQYEALVADPTLAPQATEECLRWSSVVTMAVEYAAVDTRLGEVTIGAGDRVYVVLPAANRDPRRFPDPDRLRIDRPNSGEHLAFGALGPHHCLGAPLGRLELSVLLGIIARRFPGLQLAEDQLEWRDSLYFRGPHRLRVAP